MSSDNRVEQLLSESKFAFVNAEYEKALEMAIAARDIEPNNAEVHKNVANAYFFLNKAEEAIKCYQIALKFDPRNGNRYFDCGFACANAGKMGEAIKYLAKAEEIGCSPRLHDRLYRLIGGICLDNKRYDDALANFSQAVKIKGPDLDILQRMAIAYSMKKDVKNGLQIANQIKLLSPTDYAGYRFAFRFLTQAGQFDLALGELKRAAKYVKPSMDIYSDYAHLEVLKQKKDNDNKHYIKALKILDVALKNTQPTADEVFDCYIAVANIYLQITKPNEAIRCLNAAMNVVEAFNEGFEILPYKPEETHETSEYEMQEEMLQFSQEFAFGAFDEFDMMGGGDSFSVGEDATLSYLTNIDEVAVEEDEEDESYKIEGEFKLNPNKKDDIYTLYMRANEMKGDFAKVIDYARLLQASPKLASVHAGKYAEAFAKKSLGHEDADKKLRELVTYFNNAAIKDPSDISAIPLKTNCLIELGEFDEAERMASLMGGEARESFMEKIKKRKGGE